LTLDDIESLDYRRSTDIFSDGFESGDTSTWSSVVQN